VRVNDLSRVAAWQCGGRESNPRPVDRKPDTLTTTPPSHTKVTRVKFISCYRKKKPLQGQVRAFEGGAHDGDKPRRHFFRDAVYSHRTLRSVTRDRRPFSPASSARCRRRRGVRRCRSTSSDWAAATVGGNGRRPASDGRTRRCAGERSS